MTASHLLEPAATVFTMEALVPGGVVRRHVQLHQPLPAGTKLYTTPMPDAARVEREECAKLMASLRAKSNNHHVRSALTIAELEIRARGQEQS